MNGNRHITQALDAEVIAGIQKDLSSTATYGFDGTMFTRSELIALVRSRIEAAERVAAAHANLHAAVAEYKKLSAKVTRVVRGLRGYVLGVHGEASPRLADFGFAPPKRRVLTPEQKAAAADKLRATRKARGTLGKRQRLKIHGVLAPPPAPPEAATPAGGSGRIRAEGASAVQAVASSDASGTGPPLPEDGSSHAVGQPPSIAGSWRNEGAT